MRQRILVALATLAVAGLAVAPTSSARLGATVVDQTLITATGKAKTWRSRAYAPTRWPKAGIFVRVARVSGGIPDELDGKLLGPCHASYMGAGVVAHVVERNCTRAKPRRIVARVVSVAGPQPVYLRVVRERLR